jgi:CHASE2 domain-containing sensor protein
MPWPWSYGQHARALDTILSYKPKAVIIDFLLVDPRNDDTLNDLVDEIARFRRAHIPIYFEGGTALPFGEAPLLPALAKTGVPILDPSINTYDGVVRQYPTSGDCFGASGKMPGKCPSLALRVYGDLFPDSPPEPLQGMMELVWGTKTAPLNIKLNHDVVTGKHAPCARDDGFLLRTYYAFFDKQTAMANCPYNTLLPADTLLDGLEDKDVENAIRGHIVFYGGALEGAQDKSYTPVNHLQANVFVHAMALDNLISYRGRPYQNVMTVFGETFSNNPAQVMAIVPIILILSLMHMRRIRARRKGAHKERGAIAEWFLDKGVENLWHWLAFFLALGIGLLLALWAGLSVANWVEDVFISVELAAMLLIGLPDSFWGYLHHVAGGTPTNP